MLDSEWGRRFLDEGLTPRQKSWTVLYENYYAKVRRYFAKYVSCLQDVDDLAQEVFFRVILNEGRMQNPHAYVWAIARHQLHAYLQDKRASRCMDHKTRMWWRSIAVHIISGACERDPLEQVSANEIKATLGLAMRHLSPLLREALTLRFIRGLDVHEAAAQAGCTVPTLKKRLHRAMRSLTESDKMGSSCATGSGLHPKQSWSSHEKSKSRIACKCFMNCEPV